jgi:hypothetical protein
MKVLEGDRAINRVRKARACTHRTEINYCAKVCTPYIILPAVWTALHLLNALFFGTFNMTRYSAFDSELGCRYCYRIHGNIVKLPRHRRLKTSRYKVI